jgi:hypothetical protein
MTSYAGSLTVNNALAELGPVAGTARANIDAASNEAVTAAQTTANAASATANEALSIASTAQTTAEAAQTTANDALPASEAGPLATQAGSSPVNAVENALGYTPPQIGTTAGTARDAAAAIAAESAAQTTANNALPLAGGTMTGVLTLAGAPTAPLQAATKAYVDGSNGIVPVTEESGPATLALTFPASGSNCYDVHLTQALTLTLAGGVAGQYQKLTLILRQPSGGGIAVTLPSGGNVLYAGNTPPTVGTGGNAVTVITFGTADAGTTYFGGL